MSELAIVPALHRATHRVGLYLQARVPDLSQGEAHLLAHLHAQDGAASVAELHRAWAHKRSTLTDMLSRLEGRGLVRRSPLPSDRRSVLVQVTAAGRRRAAAVHRALLDLERDVLAHSGAAAAAGFGTVVSALAAAAGHPRGARRRA
jgi:DNA-binding MarR family transcriptional regulator